MPGTSRCPFPQRAPGHVTATKRRSSPAKQPQVVLLPLHSCRVRHTTSSLAATKSTWRAEAGTAPSFLIASPLLWADLPIHMLRFRCTGSQLGERRMYFTATLCLCLLL